MSIWTFKAHALALSAICALSACDEMAPSTGTGGGAKAITQIDLARGDVRLATAPGFCIDRRSKRNTFALIGRCDTLGVVGIFSGQALAMIAVSTVPVAPGTTNPDADALAQTPGEGEVLRRMERGSFAVVQLRGGHASIDGVDDTHWRTAFVVNDQLVSMVLFAPPGSAALGMDGADILADTAQATQQATQQNTG